MSGRKSQTMSGRKSQTMSRNKSQTMSLRHCLENISDNVWKKISDNVWTKISDNVWKTTQTMSGPGQAYRIAGAGICGIAGPGFWGSGIAGPAASNRECLGDASASILGFFSFFFWFSQGFCSALPQEALFFVFLMFSHVFGVGGLGLD